jgi:hypothetical protein
MLPGSAAVNDRLSGGVMFLMTILEHPEEKP